MLKYTIVLKVCFLRNLTLWGGVKYQYFFLTLPSFINGAKKFLIAKFSLKLKCKNGKVNERIE